MYFDEINTSVLLQIIYKKNQYIIQICIYMCVPIPKAIWHDFDFALYDWLNNSCCQFMALAINLVQGRGPSNNLLPDTTKEHHFIANM